MSSTRAQLQATPAQTIPHPAPTASPNEDEQTSAAKSGIKKSHAEWELVPDLRDEAQEWELVPTEDESCFELRDSEQEWVLVHGVENHDMHEFVKQCERSGGSKSRKKARFLKLPVIDE